MQITQMFSDFIAGDAISSILEEIHRINTKEGWQDRIITATADSDMQRDYAMTLSPAATTSKLNMLLSFIKTKNKAYYLQKYREKKKSDTTKAQAYIENADIRLWHMGIWYSMMEKMQKGDFLFFYGLNDPSLSSSPEAIITSKKCLADTKGMGLNYVAESRQVVNELLQAGIEKDISLLPLFHTYNLPYIKHSPAKLSLLTWGRYAVNKGIPEISEMCAENSIPLTTFGESERYEEFREEYQKAKHYAQGSDSIKILPKLKDTDKDAMLLQSFIYISNSRNEGFGMPLVEAYAHSMPAIVRRGTAQDELMIEGKTGYLYDDIAEVPHLLKKVKGDYSRMSRAAWELSRNYTREKYAKRYKAILKEARTSKQTSDERVYSATLSL
jgi:glycosyltransferase involved in cell wall biosynthesis